MLFYDCPREISNNLPSTIWKALVVNSGKAMATHSSTLAWKIPWTEVGCSPWGHEESDQTEQLHFHFSLSCIGRGNGNPLQCSCLENPRDGRAWWAAIIGVAHSRTRLKWLSSSISSKLSLPQVCLPRVFHIWGLRVYLLVISKLLNINTQIR